MLTIKILFTIKICLKKRKNYLFKTLFTIPVDLKSTYFSLERVNLTKKNLFELKTFHFNKKNCQPIKFKSFFQLFKKKNK